jgi:hypothetical protein
MMSLPGRRPRTRCLPLKFYLPELKFVRTGGIFMSIKQFIEDSLNRQNQLLTEAVSDLTPAELAWQPGPQSNPIGWTLWHLLRVEDMWVQFFAQRRTEIWERDGWHETFGLPPRDNGFGHTTEQVSSFPALALTPLLQYGEAVRAGTLEFLRGLDPAGLAATPWADRPNMWWHDFPVVDMFRQIIGELYQHLGQIAYLKGIQRGFGALPPTFGAPR